MPWISVRSKNALNKGCLAVRILQGFFNIVREGGGGQTHVKKMSYFVKTFWHKMHVILA